MLLGGGEAKGTATQTGPNTIDIQGCQGILCNTIEYYRVGSASAPEGEEGGMRWATGPRRATSCVGNRRRTGEKVNFLDPAAAPLKL